jgi:hypothetical protein
MADNREATMFRKVADGYLFRAPNPWVFGRARFYLVSEAQKAQLLAIVTARSQAVFWVALVGLILATTAALAYFPGHEDPTIWDIIVLAASVPVWLYAALLIAIRPTARRLQPLLDRLPTTDRQISAAELRAAVRKALSPRQGLMIGLSHAVIAVAMIALALVRLHDGPVSLYGDAGVWIFSFAAAAFVASSVSFLVAARNRSRLAPDQGVPAERSFAGYGLPIFCVVVALGLLGFVVTTTLQKTERDHRTAQIQRELDSLKARIGEARTAADPQQERAAIQSRIDTIQAEIKALRR